MKRLDLEIVLTRSGIKSYTKSLFYCRSSIACENICFSTLFTDGGVSCGGTSPTQQQKFHTDDVKYVQNLVRNPDWSTE